ncbi:MAG TPA: hypothetical protein VIH91_01260 [Terriglobales bacterium]
MSGTSSLAPEDRCRFHVVGTVAFMAYGLSQLTNGIWKGEP